MEVTFRHSPDGPRMQISALQKDQCDPYILPMLRSNQVPGLLPVYCENVDTQPRLIYDISARQSLAKILETGPVSEELISALLHSLRQCIAHLPEYLLEADWLMLRPELIYTDMQRKRFRFCLNPFSDETFGQNLRTLLDELVKAADPADEHLAERLYRLHSAAYQDNCSLPRMEELFQKEDAGKLHVRQVFLREEDSRKDPEYEIRPQPEPPADLFGQPEREGLFAKLAAFIRGPQESEEKAVCPGMSAEEEKELLESVLFTDTPEQGTVHLERETAGCRLMGTGAYSDQVFEIGKFPFTIGKLEEEADCVLREKTVSRIHARIYRTQEDPGYAIEDLNSTNGTRLNGVKLEAYTRSALHSGDLIRIADREFVFR